MWADICQLGKKNPQNQHKKGPRNYPWYSRCNRKFAVKYLGLSWGKPKVVACVLSIYASGKHESFLPIDNPLAAIFPRVLQSADWCFEIEDLRVWKEDKV